MGRELEDIFTFSKDESFFKSIIDCCKTVCQTAIEDYEFELLLISNKGEIL